MDATGSQVFTLDPALMPAVLAGEKRAVILLGLWPYALDARTFIARTDALSSVPVQLREIRIKRLGELQDEEARLIGAFNAPTLVTQLKQAWNERTTDQSIVTLFLFDLLDEAGNKVVFSQRRLGAVFMEPGEAFARWSLDRFKAYPALYGDAVAMARKAFPALADYEMRLPTS